MDRLKNTCLKLLYPHAAIIAVLFPISLTIMLWSMLVLGTTHFISIIGYVLSAYSLTTVCFRIPDIIKFIKYIKNENKYIQKYIIDKHMRLKITIIISLAFNFFYALFQFFIGLYHSSFWFYSMFVYYFILTIIRLFLSSHILKYSVNENEKTETIKYLICGYLMLILNIALTVMVIFMVVWDKTFNHHQITTIALAAYTFTSFTVAIVSYIKYRKFKSPVYSAAKSISLTSASVSIITLEATMLTSFGANLEPIIRKIFLGLTGAAVSAFVIILAIHIIKKGIKQLKEYKEINITKEGN